MAYHDEIGNTLSWAEWHDLGNHAASTGNGGLAERLYDNALMSTDSVDCIDGTESAQAILRLGKRQDLDWCIDVLRNTAQRDPGQINHWINLATAYIKIPLPKMALEAAMEGFKLDNHNADILQTLATCHGMLGNVREEIQFAWLAADVDPARRFQHAMVNMKVSKDFPAFAKHYAGRKKPLGPEILKPINIGKPGTVLVCMEQGLGDLIMMGSVMKRLAANKFELFLYTTEKACADIGRMMWPFLKVIEQPTKAGSYDYVVNLMDLLEFGPPELRWDQNSISPWISHEGFPTETPKSFVSGKVGVNFTGNPKYEYEYCRGIYDERIRGLILDSCNSVNLNDYRDGTMDEFKSIMARLKGVITTDTMTAHLAGAMGVPCLVLLAKNHDWRWCHKWYGNHLKTATQSAIGYWDSVLPDVEKFVKEIA